MSFLTSVQCRSVAATSAAVLLLSLMALVAPPAQAQQTFIVDASHITGDAANDDPNPDGCDSGNDCSLREAVIAANADPAGDRIEFEVAGTVQIERFGAADEDVPDPEFNDLDVTQALTVVGHPGGTTLTSLLALIEDSRIFDAEPSTSPFELVLEDLVFEGGDSGDDGGAVRTRDTDLTVRQSTFTQNRAVRGAGISMSSGSLVIEDSSFEMNDSLRDGGALLVSQLDTAQITGTTFTDNTAGVLCCLEDPSSGGNGGAIAAVHDNGDDDRGQQLGIATSTFSGNSAIPDDGGGQGGAIFSDGVPFSIEDSVIDGNGGGSSQDEETEATRQGGGIYYDNSQGATEPFFLRNTSITNNTSTGRGGGIHAGARASLVIDQSTVAGNTATGPSTGEGGGVYMSSDRGLFSLTNSTVSGNTSVFNGGGLQFGPEPISLDEEQTTIPVIAFSTIVRNDGDSDGEGTDGSGIHVGTDTLNVRIGSSLVAENGQRNCSPAASVRSQGYNLEDTDTCNFDQPNDQTDNDPVIGPLSDNGGQSQGADSAAIGQTHALLQGSPAIDAVDTEECQPSDPIDFGTDQRLVSRPQLTRCDVGAYEYVQPFDIAVDKTVSPTTVDTGTDSTFTITVTNPAPSSAGTVTLTDVVPAGLVIGTVTPSAGTCGPPAGQTVTCDLGQIGPDDTVTVTIIVSAPMGGTYTNTATIEIDDGEGDGDPSNDSAEATLTVIGDMVLSECTGGLDGEGDPVIVDGINRIRGPDRIQTATAASQAVCLEGEAPAVVLTRADLFPDAQAGTPLAIQLGAPLLLSDPATLSPETEVEIQRVLSPGGTVYLLGGEAALSATVEQRLVDLGYSIIRYGGQNRYGTAAIIADDGLTNPPNILVANGGDFADSVVAGAASINVDTRTDTVQAAVLLTSDANVPPETQGYLDAQTSQPDIIAIGAAAAQAFPAAESVFGPSRFETAIAVAERFFEDPPVIGIARADDFADGLTGGALIGRPLIGPGPIILTDTNALSATVETYLDDNAGLIDSALIFGGSVAVSQTVEDNISSTLGFP